MPHLPMACLTRSSLRQLTQNFLMCRKLTGLVLTVDESSIQLHVEDSSSASDQFRIDAGRFLDRFRQTGGFRCVVSLYAVFN